MVQPTRPPSNRFVASARKVYNPLGFSKGYNFILFFIFAGALMGFTLARFQYLSFNNVFCNPSAPGGTGAAPGECYFYTRGHYKAGIILHLSTILPAAFLACFQFVPAIRHRALLLHRLNGYTILLLVPLSNAGALLIARHAFGGGLDIQAAVGLLALVTTAALALSYYNIKRLQIEQHRAWMLRAWFYLGSIITTRIIMILAAFALDANRSYWAPRPCAQLAYIHHGNRSATLTAHPACAPYFAGTEPGAVALVRASMSEGGGEAVGVALGMGFGMALWLALVVHAAGVEVYLQLTPAEAERLRNVSYQRQLEAGMKNPGSAGLTADRVGDAAAWVPAVVREEVALKGAVVEAEAERVRSDSEKE